MRCLHLFFLALGAALTGVSQAQMNEFVPGEVLVGYRSEFVRAQASSTFHAAISSRGGMSLSERAEQIVLPRGMTVMDAVAYYQGRPGVEYAEPNYYRSLTFSPNDSRYSAQSQLRDIQCDDAWDITKGKASVVIAVIDTGIDKSHPDLRNKIVAGWDFVSNDADPSSNHVHGSHTAGLAAADTNNGIGIAGAGFGSRIMPIRVSPSVPASQSSAAIRFAADRGAKVISMSYAAPSISSAERAATEYAWNKGCVLLASAGNLGTSVTMYPAGYADVISVGSIDDGGSRSNFSNHGATVDVAAPGEGVVSTIPGGNYGELTGTSMSCPLTAGTVALLWSMGTPETTNAQIRDALLNNCDDIGDWLNYGRVNARRAVESLQVSTEFVSSPSSIQCLVGTNASGSLADILATDGSAFTAQSMLQAAGQIAEFESNVTLSGPASNLTMAQLRVVATGPSGAALTVSVRKSGLPQFQTVGSVALRPSNNSIVAINLPSNLSPILNGGVLQIRLRSVLPRRPFGRAISPYFLGLNSLNVATRPGP